MPAEDIDLSNAIRIAHVSSESNGYTRWSELSVYFLNDPTFRKKQWVAEVSIRSVEPGEDALRRRVFRAGTLDRALTLFSTHDNEFTRIVRAEAEDWEEDHSDEIHAFYQALRPEEPAGLNIRGDR